MMVTSGSDENLQIAMLLFADGQPKGYQIINKTRTASLGSNIAADQEGHLHLTWVDTAGFGRLQVLYASTSPRVKETLNRLTTTDVINSSLYLGMNVLSMLTFVPVAIAWALLPTLWLISFYLVTDESELTTRRAWWALGVALLLLFLSKAFLFPDLLSYVPRIEELPPRFASVLARWFLPLLLTAIAMAAMLGYLRRTESRALFTAYFIVLIIDSFLSLFIYVSTLMGSV